MSLQDRYSDLMNMILVKKLRNPSALIKLLNELQELSEFFGTLKGDTGEVTASTAGDEFTIEGGDYINSIVTETGGGVKKVTLSSTVSPLNYKGTHDASTGSYPSGASAGDYYVADTAGTISGTYYNVNDWMVYNGSSWDKIEGATVVLNDPSPQLGGNLDLNSKKIQDAGGNDILGADGSGNIDVLATLSANIAFSGAQTVDGVDVSALALDNLPTSPSGSVGFNSQAITSVGNVDGVDISGIALDNMPTAPTTAVGFNSQNINSIGTVTIGANAVLEYNSTDNSLDFTVS